MQSRAEQTSSSEQQHLLLLTAEQKQRRATPPLMDEQRMGGRMGPMEAEESQVVDGRWEAVDGSGRA